MILLGRNKLLCYKVCYALGVPDFILKQAYKDIWEVSTESGYFDNRVTVNEFRSISHIYFMCAKHYDLYSASKSIIDVAGERFDAYLKHTRIDMEHLYKSNGDLGNFLHNIAMRANSLLPDVYRELATGLLFTDFYNLFSLPTVSMRPDFSRIEYILAKSHNKFNIYFWFDDLLNINNGEVLSSDVILLRRLSISSGRTIDVEKDKSVLVDLLRDRDDKYFINILDLAPYFTIYVDGESVNRKCLNKLATLYGDKVQIVPEKLLGKNNKLKAGISFNDSSVYITAVYDEKDMFYPDNVSEYLPVIVCLPAPQKLFTSIISGQYPNLRLMSYK